MKFYKNLYIGDTIKDPNRVKKKLKHRARQLKVFVIMLASGDDQLEICHSMLLRQPFYRIKENEPYIIGIAGNYDEAVEIIIKITNEAVLKNGNAALKQYLFS